MAAKINPTVSLILKILVAVGLIAFTVKSGHLDFATLWGLMTPTNIAVGILLSGFGTLMAAWRWIVLLNARDFNVTGRYGIKLYLIGMFFNCALPGAVSGDLVRGYYLVKDHPARKLDGILSVLIDRVLGLYSFFILTLFAVAMDHSFVMGHEKIRWIALLTFLLFIGMTLFFLVSFSERLYHGLGFKWITAHISPLQKLMEGFQRFGKDRFVIALSVAVSLVSQLFSLAIFYYIAQAMGETDVGWKSILFAVPMGFLVTAIPIAPAGVGVGQVAFLYLFNIYLGRESQYGATAITAFQLAMIFWALVGAVIYVRRRKPHELDGLQAGMQETPT